MCFFLQGCTTKEIKTTENSDSLKNRIVLLLEKSKEKSNTTILRLENALQAHKLSSKINSDSLWFSSLDRVTILQYKLKKNEDYKIDAYRYLNTATKLKDSIKIAKGSYKVGSYYFRRSMYDSAFYHFNKAQLIFSKKRDSLQAGKNLLNMAIIQTNSGDYYASEGVSLKALKYLKNEKKKRYTLAVYNNLGVISSELKQYEDAIYWYDKALGFSKKDRQKIVIWNNLGLVYRNHTNYKNALECFARALKYTEIDSYFSEKAMLLDNIGYTYFLMGRDDALEKMEKAFLLRKEENNNRGLTVSNLHIGEYYLTKKSYLKAHTYFKRALLLSKQTKDVKSRLKALYFLSKNVVNNHYIKTYVKLNDSLISRERFLKYQFATITYKSNEQELKNAKLEQQLIVKTFSLEKQENRNILLFLVITSLLIVLVVGYFYYLGQKRLEKQRLIIEKLKARSDEKERLSMHLHDDIASDLLIGLQRIEALNEEFKNKEFEQVVFFFDRAYLKMREISQELSTRFFNHIPIQKRIEKLCNEYSFKHDMSIECEGVELISWKDVDAAIKEAVISILREAIGNTIKHSKATHVEIFFEMKKEILFQIKDNGKGYYSVDSQGIGIHNMKKRVQELDGIFKISNTDIGSGTIISVSIPMH